MNDGDLAKACTVVAAYLERSMVPDPEGAAAYVAADLIRDADGQPMTVMDGLAACVSALKGLNNAIEVSHRPTRKRQKITGRFKYHRQAQRFLSAHDQINLIFRPRYYQLTATSYRHAGNDAFRLWVDYNVEMTA